MGLERHGLVDGLVPPRNRLIQKLLPGVMLGGVLMGAAIAAAALLLAARVLRSVIVYRRLSWPAEMPAGPR